MHPVKEGKNEWVKTKCICVSTIFISGINCKHVYMIQQLIKTKKLKRKIEICILVPLWLLADIFYQLFISVVSLHVMVCVRCTYWMTFPICNLIHRLSILYSYFFEQQLGIGKGRGCEWVGVYRSILKPQTRLKLKPESSWQLSFNYLYWKPSNDINTVLNVCEILDINLQRAQLKQIS